MSAKRKQEQSSSTDSSSNSNEIVVPCPSVEGTRCLQQDLRRIKCSRAPTANGQIDDSVKASRHVHWLTDESGADDNRQNSTDDKQHSIGVEADHVRGGNEEGGREGGSKGSGGGSGESGGESGGGLPLSGHRLISVKPFAATSDDDNVDDGEERVDDDGDNNDNDNAGDDDDLKKLIDRKYVASITTSTKIASRVTRKNAAVSKDVATPQSNILSDLPVIDLESDACNVTGLEGRHRRCVNEPYSAVDAVRTSSGPDHAKPKSFLADFNGTINVTKPTTAFEDPNKPLEVEPVSVPLVTVSYLRHDPMAAAGDANRSPTTIPEVSEVPSHGDENGADIVGKKLDGGATGIRGMTLGATFAAAAAASAAVGAAGAVGAVGGAENPPRSASSSSSQSLDRTSSLKQDFSSDLSLLRNPVEPFARVEPDEAFLAKRGECDGQETPAPVYILPGANLRYTDDTILTTRPSKVNLLYSPAPPRTRILFQIIRDKVGFYRKYYAHLELGGEKIFYLAGRKRVKSRSSSYVISIDRERLLRDCDAYVGKLRSNYMGTKFTLYYTAAETPPSTDEDRRATGARRKHRQREELASIIYAPNPLGFYGPRRMTVILPAITETGERIPIASQTGQEETLLGRYKARQFRDLIILHNKPPVWERAKNSYVLNFHGRVTQPSVKNFQLVPPDDHNDIVMQFGRTGANSFTMDYRRPLSAVQAFGVVLSCFDCKLACE